MKITLQKVINIIRNKFFYWKNSKSNNGLSPMNLKKIAIDCYYYTETDCYSVGIVFDNWKDQNPLFVIDSHIKNFERYQPGMFYKRELPGIMSILKQIDLTCYDTIIVDGYTWLQDDNGIIKPGLGMHVYNEIHKKYPQIKVVGVGKTKFGKNQGAYAEVFRGQSKNPLLVTCNNNKEKDFFADKVKHMCGRYRLPLLLKTLDHETKKYKNDYNLKVDYKDTKQTCKKRPYNTQKFKQFFKSA